MVVTEPFATAYGIGEISGSICVDIGAGTTDIARLYGIFPTEEDQVTIQEAGDWIDMRLMELVQKKYTGAQVTKDMVRKWKEEFSYVNGEDREQMVELSVEGKKQVVDIGDLIKAACSMVIGKVGAAIKSIVATADPEYQPILRNNIILSGGGSLIEGIADAIANDIADIGDVTVTCVEDPIEKVATGAMALAQPNLIQVPSIFALRLPNLRFYRPALAKLRAPLQRVVQQDMHEAFPLGLQKVS